MSSDTPSSPGDAAERAARILAQALIEAEVIVALDRESRPQPPAPELIEALDRFAEVLTQLVEHTEHLASRMATLSDAVASLVEQQAHPPASPEPRPQLPEMEPSFAPGGEGIDVTIAAVPGFQGLMEIQRALVHLPQVQSAAVRRYQEDEAAIQLVLSQPMTAAAIAEGVTNGTAKQIIVDEARTDALRLRLRFLSS